MLVVLLWGSVLHIELLSCRLLSLEVMDGLRTVIVSIPESDDI